MGRVSVVHDIHLRRFVIGLLRIADGLVAVLSLGWVDSSWAVGFVVKGVRKDLAEARARREREEV